MEKVIKLTGTTQKKVFRNCYDDGQAVVETEEVYCKDRKKKVDVNRIIQISLNEGATTVYRKLNDYDRAVHNAVCSLVDTGIRTFTTEQLYRVMCGSNTKQIDTCSSQIRADLENALDNMSMRKIKIDFAEEDELFKLNLTKKDGTKITAFKNYILPLQEFTLKLKNGKTTKAWQLLAYPPLYSYAKAKKQITALYSSHLNIPLRMDDRNVILREYLLDRILTIKGVTTPKGTLRHGYENTNIILFSSIYELLGEDGCGGGSAACHQRKRVLEKCERIFTYWKDETGLLINWCYSKKSGANKPDGFKVEVDIRKFLEDRMEIALELDLDAI